MAQKASISSFSEAELYVVFEHVFEYINDVATLASLTLVSKRFRNTVHRSNGIRQLTCGCETDFHSLNLNEVAINRGDRQERLKNGLRWLWTVGKRLKTVRWFSKFNQRWLYNVVLPLLNSLATTEKRRIETIEFVGMPCEMALKLVRENCNTLRCLRVEHRHFQQYMVSTILNPLEVSLMQPTLSEVAESLNFWSVAQQCKRLDCLDLTLFNSLYATLAEFSKFLCKTPLKHLSLTADKFFSDSIIQNHKVVEALTCENLRNSLEILTLDYGRLEIFFEVLTAKVISPHISAFFNVIELTFNFVPFCYNQYMMNWLPFWAIFPAVKHIKDNSLYWDRRPIHLKSGFVILSQNMSSFCKTYLDASGKQLQGMKIEIHVGPNVGTNPNHHSGVEKLTAAVAKAVTLPEDQAWCVFHGVHIETETRDEKIEKVTLRKDTSTLVFNLKYRND